MLLGIVLHGLLSFIPLPIWPAQDIHQNEDVYGLIIVAIHGFRMPLFFFIGGFFTAMMWKNRGLGSAQAPIAADRSPSCRIRCNPLSDGKPCW